MCTFYDNSKMVLYVWSFQDERKSLFDFFICEMFFFVWRSFLDSLVVIVYFLEIL